MHLPVKLAAMAIMVVLLLPGACRDEPPPDRFNGNLGTFGEPLMPTSPRSRDGQILNGRATLVPAQDLEALQKTADPRSAIEEVVTAFRDAYRRGDDDALASLVVERQREAVQQTAPASAELREAVGEFRETIEPLDPQPAFYAQVAPMIDAMIDLPLDVANLEIISDTEATLPVPPTPEVIRLEKHGDAWLVALPDVDDIDAANRRLRAGTDLVTSLTELLKDTSLSPADRGTRIMQLVADFAAAGASDEGGSTD